MSKFNACLAQISPVFLDKEATTEKAVGAILEAGQHGARLIILPEAYIPGYPYVFHFSINRKSNQIIGGNDYDSMPIINKKMQYFLRI